MGISIGAPMGNCHRVRPLPPGDNPIAVNKYYYLEGGSSTREFERWMRGHYEWSTAHSRGSVPRASGEGFFTGDPGKYVKKCSGHGHLNRDPVREPGGDSLAGTFGRKG